MQELFERALERPSSERASWLATECGGDDSLRAEVESLLAAADAAPAFLERPAADVELEGARAGPWRIEALLSSGGMGDVHRAVRADGDLEWRVALKVLRHGLDGEQFVRRFEAERRTLASLAHPNIVALIDAGTLDDGRPWLATELVQGLPIDRHCEERRLSIAGRVQLVLAVCEAVAHAHRRLVLHCDLKPGNVLVTAEGLPKLLDFGIARLIGARLIEDRAEAHEPRELRDGARAFDDSGAARGAPAVRDPGLFSAGYASPEQVEGRPLECASDVFSLGVLLRVVATGERPTEPASDVALRALGRDLAAIVRKATAPDPAHRYASADHLAAELRAWLERRPVAARGGGALDRFAKLVRRNRLASAALLVAIASLAAGSIALVRDLQRSRADALAEASLGWRAHAQAVSVSRFLEELTLDAAGRDPAALAAALDRAASRLEGRIEWPEAEGRARAALGALYLRIDRPDAARPHLQRALDLARSHRGFGRQDVEHLQELLAAATSASASGIPSGR